jgi:iron complex outermembrane receptor protein
MNTVLIAGWKKVSVLLVLFVLAGNFMIQAQTHVIRGTVFDEFQQPLQNANVLLESTQFAMVTDQQGAFSFDVPSDTYTLRVSYVGYRSHVRILEVNRSQTLSITLLPEVEALDEVLVAAVRVSSGSPVTHSNVSKEELGKRNLGQDIHILMNYLPGVVTTSDAGAGVGYTGIRVRGSDATRVNVTINGIPYNDAESQGTFWVNLPDFVSSVESLQLQRGVGTSTNGSGAFGASLNLLTDAISQKGYAEIGNAFGSYNTRKHTVKFSTGLLNNNLELSGRLSKIDSDGYIDRAWSDLKSYFLQAAYRDDNTLIKALTFGGHEKTYQAWYGTPMARIENDQAGIEAFISENWLNEAEAENLRNSDRRYNYYTYENEIDNYQQDHYQLHWNERLSDLWSLNLGLNFTQGAGYFEQYKADEDFADYDLDPMIIGNEIIDQTDLIRRRWLDNTFYVANLNTRYRDDKMELMVGTSISNYNGAHFGEIIWAEYVSQSEIRDRYYESDARKNDANLFAKATYKIDDTWTIYGDLQGRFISYTTSGLTSDRVPLHVDKNFSFFNPKAGITYRMNADNSLYLSYARAQREPNRTDFEYGVDTAEILNDFELGWRHARDGFRLHANLYYMAYRDQLVLTGAVDDVGAFIRATSGKSYRFGVEVDASIRLSEHLTWMPNFALSRNKNVDFFAPLNGTLVDLGTTDLSFSPDFIAGNLIRYQPTNALELSLLSKYVGEQVMGNLSSAVSSNDVLESYFVSDLSLGYTLNPKKVFKAIRLTALVNNIFDTEYVSNGYYYTYDDTWSVPGQTTTVDGAGFYPQATRNYLLGMTLIF